MVLKFIPQNGGRLISRGHGQHPERIIDSWEFIFVVRGKLAMFVGLENYTINAGQCLLLPPGIRHGGQAPYSKSLSFFWVHFLPGNAQTLKHLKNMPCQFSVQNPGRLSEYCQLFMTLQEEDPNDQSALTLIIDLIFHEAEKVKNPINPQDRPELPPLLQQVRNILKIRFREPLSTSYLAQHLQCNPDYLGRLYRQYFQKTITAALQEIRITHAAELLRSSTMNIAQIAEESGFNDGTYFRRCFFKYYAKSPNSYRKLQKLGHVNTE